MRTRVAVAAAGLVVGLVGSTLAASPAPAAPEAGTATNASVASFVRGPLRGIVYSRTVDHGEVEVRFALQGLQAGRDHVVAAVPRPCSQIQPPGMEDRWAVRFEADDDGAVFVRRRVTLLNPFEAIRSIRVFRLAPPAPPVEEIACSSGLIGHVDPPGASAAPNASVASWVRGPHRGIAYARASGEVSVDVRFSLAGLAPSSTHLLAGSRLPCTRPARDSQSVWVVDFTSDAEGNRTFRRRLTERFGTFADQRSTRIYVVEDPGQFGVQVSCVPGVVGRLRPA